MGQDEAAIRRQLLSFKSTVATVFDTVDECNCGVLATQASVGPTRVGCYFLIVIATAGAGGFYRSTGLLAGIVARSVDNHDRSLGRMVVRVSDSTASCHPLPLR